MPALRDYLAELPLVAILRGLTPGEAVPVGEALVAVGFRVIEVPLNSPEPFDSLARLARALPDSVLLGAGTVLDPDDVERVRDAGGKLIVMPHADQAVLGRARARGLICTPGCATPTEAFAALASGADGLKMFPAEGLPPAVVKAWRAVLPRETILLPVGGIKPESMPPFVAAGASGFGLGSALFTPALTVEQVGANARAFAAAWRELRV